MMGGGAIGFIAWLLDMYSWVIIAAALISWVNPNPRNPSVAFLRRVTEPVLEPVRRLLPPGRPAASTCRP